MRWWRLKVDGGAHGEREMESNWNEEERTWRLCFRVLEGRGNGGEGEKGRL